MNKWKEKLRNFMLGRYGSDELNRFGFWIFIVCLLLSMFLRADIFYWAAIVIMVLIYYRMFSKNVSRRYEENQKFLRMKEQLRVRMKGQAPQNTDPYHKIYKCPKCGQKTRVPKGKGKIAIRCPKCGHEFIKRT